MEKRISEAHRTYATLLTDFANAKTSDDAALIFIDRVQTAFGFTSQFVYTARERFPSLKNFVSNLTQADFDNFNLLKTADDEVIDYPVYEFLIDEFRVGCDPIVMTYDFSGYEADEINNIDLVDYDEGHLVFAIYNEDNSRNKEIRIDMTDEWVQKIKAMLWEYSHDAIDKWQKNKAFDDLCSYIKDIFKDREERVKKIVEYSTI